MKVLKTNKAKCAWVTLKMIEDYRKAINGVDYGKAVNYWLDLGIMIQHNKKVLSPKMYRFMVRRVNSIMPVI